MYRSGSGIWRIGQSGIATAQAAAGGNDPLYTSLVAYWKLDEASGNRADSVGSNTLADINTVTSNTGLVYPLAAEYTQANNERLQVADNASLSMGDIDAWWAVWVYHNALSNQITFQKGFYNGASAAREYGLYLADVNGTYSAWVSNGTQQKTATVINAVTATTWSLVVGLHDAANNRVGLSVNGSSPTWTAHTGGIQDSGDANTLTMVGSYSPYVSGRIGPAMVGKNYCPTDADLTWLYNGGSGRTLVEMAAL